MCGDDDMTCGDSGGDGGGDDGGDAALRDDRRFPFGMHSDGTVGPRGYEVTA